MSSNETITLESLVNTTRAKKSRKIVGRGPGSGLGKTSGRGQKGAKARSGYKRRYGKEGGGVPLYRRVPVRGFSNARFRKRLDHINLALIEKMFQDGEVVSVKTLREKCLIKGTSHGLKVLAEGTLTKKVTFEKVSFSAGAREKLEAAKILVSA